MACFCIPLVHLPPALGLECVPHPLSAALKVYILDNCVAYVNSESSVLLCKVTMDMAVLVTQLLFNTGRWAHRGDT